MSVILSCVKSFMVILYFDSFNIISLFCWRKLFIDTFREEHRVQFQASPVLKARRQLGEVVAVQIEDNLQGLTTSLDVVEDMSICRNTDKTLAALPQPEKCETIAIRVC